MALRETNLIPPEVLARRDFQRHLSFWLGCLVISLSLIWGFYFYQRHLLQSKRRTVAELKQKHQDLGTKINEIRRIQAELDRMRQEQAGLENITLAAPYSQIFAKLADIMNEDTWLSQLTIESGREEESFIRLRLTGFSFSADELGNFLQQLINEPFFQGVVLQNARENETSQFSRGSGKTVRLIQFNIECKISKV
ncbi:MAG: PilN domain-containing protein [Deltaproteobacteria bacterium]|nr:PilN domain-containing protein [Deltaproteobacteria bacterium]